MSDESSSQGRAGSSVRSGKTPPMVRRVWILGFDKERIEEATRAIESAGHEVKSCEPGGDLSTTIRDFRPDVVIIDMLDNPDRGRHAATQLRADRATRQLPIILVSVSGEERTKSDESITGPTRRYVNGLTAPSVLNSIVVDL